MNWQSLELWQIVAVFAAFALALSIWLIVVIVWILIQTRRQRRISRRLGLTNVPEEGKPRELHLWVENRVAHTWVPGGGRSLAARVRRLHAETGWEASLPALAMNGAGLCALGFLAALAWSGSLFVAIIAVVAILLGLNMLLGHRLAQRRALFERQLLDALGLATRSLRAGHPLSGAFQLVATEMEPPISRVFGEICQLQEMGVGMDEAIVRTVKDSPSEDLRLFATAVLIQLRSGGNLADMMDRLAQVIRERMRLTRRVRVLTTQTQFSKRVLLAMPFVIYLILSLINPEYVAYLHTTRTGIMMLSVAGLGMIVGSWVMNRIATLRY